MQRPPRDLAITSREDFDFYNELGEKYPETRVVHATRAGKLRKRFLTRLLGKMQGRLLDVGCNNYPYEHHWAGEYVGVDISLSPLLSGNRNGVWSDVYSLPFRDGVFDVVLCVEVLEHLSHRVEALREMLRVMKDRGELIIVVPHGYEPFKVVWMNELSRWGVRHYYYLHGDLSFPYVKALSSQTPFNISEHKYLVSDQRHIYLRAEKVSRHG